MIRNKKAAMEMSMGTIIILVLGVSMLILGMVLIRNIMCSGLQITKDITTGVRNEIQNLFGADKIGVKCAGEGGQEINLATNGVRDVICVIKTEEQAKYDIKVVKVESLSGASSDIVNSWIVDKDFSGDVKPGEDKSVVYLSLKLPKDAPKTIIKVTLSVTNANTGSTDTVITRLNVVPTGFIKGAIC